MRWCKVDRLELTVELGTSEWEACPVFWFTRGGQCGGAARLVALFDAGVPSEVVVDRFQCRSFRNISCQTLSVDRSIIPNYGNHVIYQDQVKAEG